jgi:hypothetical protein
VPIIRNLPLEDGYSIFKQPDNKILPRGEEVNFGEGTYMIMFF